MRCSQIAAVEAGTLVSTSWRKVVSIVEGQRMTTDGPFAESKEFLAGFFLVDCASLDRAIEHASRIPEAAFGLVEVRPVMSLGDFEV